MTKRYITADCPRCAFKDRKFKVKEANNITEYDGVGQFGEKDYEFASYELFAVCPECEEATVFIICEKHDDENQAVMSCAPPMQIEGSLDEYFHIAYFICLSRNPTRSVPEFIPENIETAFKEGTACLAIKNWSAAGAMFRKCLDLTAKDKLAKKDHGKKLSIKIKCLLQEKILPEDLKKIAKNIMLDGNDGLHNRTLTEEEAEDSLVFTSILLRRIYTEPERKKETKEIIKEMEEIRAERKAKAKRKAKREAKIKLEVN